MNAIPSGPLLPPDATDALTRLVETARTLLDISEFGVHPSQRVTWESADQMTRALYTQSATAIVTMMRQPILKVKR